MTATQNPNAITFYTNEFTPVVEGAKGPVESFVVLDDKEVQARAIETGQIEPGAFRNCAMFGDQDAALAQKYQRYETARAQGIYNLLEEGQEGERTLDHELARLNMEQEMLRAVIVEASRKYNREQQDGTLTPSHAELYGRVLEQAQAELYPSPDPKIIAHTTHLLMVKIGTNNPDRHAALAEKYPFLDIPSEDRPEIMSQETRDKWHKYLHEEYDGKFSDVREEMNGEISNETLMQATALFMEKVGLPMTDNPEDHTAWMVEDRTKDVVGFRIDPERLRVLCGRRSKEITWPVFEQLMMHEIVIHATRAQRGYESGHKAMQNGMPGNQETEEGLGLLMEKLWSGSAIDAVGRDHYRYMANCYADGALDGQKHTETETLDFVTDLMASTQKLTTDFETKKQEVRRLGYDHVKRPYRGMPPGYIMNSNLSYLSGKIKAAGNIEASPRDPADELEYIQTGKFNIVDSTQTAIADRVRAAAA